MACFRGFTRNRPLLPPSLLEPGKISDADVKYATRCWALRWAAIAFKVHGKELEIVATAVGGVECEQTVFRAEATAAEFVAMHTAGQVDITLDCLGVKKRTESPKAGRKSEDLFEALRDEKDRLNLRWIKSHLSREQFSEEYGAHQLWRWKANQEVDYLVGRAANAARCPEQETEIKQREQNALVALKFLAERVRHLFSVSKDEGPQTEFRKNNKQAASSSTSNSGKRQGVNPASKQLLKQNKPQRKPKLQVTRTRSK